MLIKKTVYLFEKCELGDVYIKAMLSKKTCICSTNVSLVKGQLLNNVRNGWPLILINKLHNRSRGTMAPSLSE